MNVTDHSIFTDPNALPNCSSKQYSPPKESPQGRQEPFRATSFNKAETPPAGPTLSPQLSPPPQTLTYSAWRRESVGDQAGPVSGSSGTFATGAFGYIPASAVPVALNKTSEKRSRDESSTSKADQPQPKRPRHHLKFRHTIEASSFPRGFTSDGQPPSPLFFSNKVRKRPPLLPRFTSSEAGAKMLSRAQTEENEGLRTVKLARGSITSGANSFRGTPTSVQNSLSPRESAGYDNGSTDVTSKENQSKGREVLSQVDIVEWLEQDERPTFILDLADTSNFQPGSLQILFANNALRSQSGLFDRICGKSGESPGLTLSSFPEFKAWTLSFTKNQEPLNVSLPAFQYAGIVWTCSTIRKRLRLVSGKEEVSPSRVGSTSSSRLTSAALEHARTPGRHGAAKQLLQAEPADYFSAVDSPGVPDAQDAQDLPDVQDAPMLDRNALSEEALSPLQREFGRSLKADTEKTSSGSPTVKARSNGRASPGINEARTNEAILRAATAGDVDAFSSGRLPSEQGFFDWTRLPSSAPLPRHIQFARSIDWSATSLGPMSEWHADLRGMCNLIMASPHPAAMYWGPEFVAIYNEPYIVLAGQKHPSLMGLRYRDAWSEIWDAIEDVFANAWLTGEATMKDDDCLFINRSGFLEETYFSWSIIPLVGSTGSVIGLYNP